MGEHVAFKLPCGHCFGRDCELRIHLPSPIKLYQFLTTLKMSPPIFNSDAQFLTHLQAQVSYQSAQEDTRPICCESFIPKNAVEQKDLHEAVKLPCGHLIGRECVRHAVAVWHHSSRPLCRAALFPVQVPQVYQGDVELFASRNEGTVASPCGERSDDLIIRMLMQNRRITREQTSNYTINLDDAAYQQLVIEAVAQRTGASITVAAAAIARYGRGSDQIQSNGALVCDCLHQRLSKFVVFLLW